MGICRILSNLLLTKRKLSDIWHGWDSKSLQNLKGLWRFSGKVLSKGSFLLPTEIFKIIWMLIKLIAVFYYRFLKAESIAVLILGLQLSFILYASTFFSFFPLKLSSVLKLLHLRSLRRWRLFLEKQKASCHIRKTRVGKILPSG